MNKVECNYAKMFSELYEIFNYLPEELLSKIPEELKENIINNRDKLYKYQYNSELKIYENQMMDETKDFIAGLYLNYMCDQSEKDVLLNECTKNDEKDERILREKYNPDDIFKDEIKVEKTSASNDLIEYKETFLKKLINKIKGILHINL